MEQDVKFPPVDTASEDVHLPAVISVGACFTIAVIYVASLYVWKSKHDRDHPSTIKRRFCSVFVVMLIAPIFVWALSSDFVAHRYTMWQIMGFRLEGLVTAIMLPLVLTATLFCGPLSVTLCNGLWRIYSEPMYWVQAVQNLMWLRNHLVAPLSEEFTFRACMLPLLLQTFRPHTAMLITPLLFGLAHLHHIKERLRDGTPLRIVLTVSFFQFFYTTIFGIYSAYLFIRTGHFAAPFVAHAFCNHMGFPDVPEVLNQTNPRKAIFLSLYVLGLVGWILLLPTLTTPGWYENNLFWSGDT
ncbi:CAAX prenyl protease 2-like [Uranotaenia lowii]|uniref:CAAX prenyl protease 2-like n=1 Tax=Uranotaenia lowii TaxID=190385 RepID=UPI00247A9203|nr:CAAX prenyl protease 2-like [Uranotaenia lowii]